MRRTTLLACLLALATGLLPALAAGSRPPRRDHAVYVPKQKFPVLEEMKKRDEEQRKKEQEETKRILDELKKKDEEKKKHATELRFDLDGIEIPAGPDAFHRAWHFPPTPQYRTGTCWAFSTTSFFESEIKRLHGREVKLSEMWTAYWEYVEKARGWIRYRGKMSFGEGSEGNAVMRIWTKYGVVPRAAYEGVLAEDGRFDHARLYEDLRAFLEWCRDRNFWDEKVIIATVRAMLDRTMGRPPESFTWQGRTYTPRTFFEEVVELNPDDYVTLMSTMKVPFWTHAEFEVPDNWWHDTNYVNVPLDTWFGVIRNAIEHGYTMVIGGDVSEPGLWGAHDIAIVPTFDIPGDYIDQDAREFRIANGTTGDDHGIHLVGWTRTKDGHEWFLIKDSNRSSRLGKYKGYYMYRDDYVRLKMLTFTVHRDMARKVLEKVAETEGAKKGD